MSGFNVIRFAIDKAAQNATEANDARFIEINKYYLGKMQSFLETLKIAGCSVNSDYTAGTLVKVNYIKVDGEYVYERGEQGGS